VRGEECVQGFDGKPEGKRPLGRPKRRWEDGIRMDLKDIGWASVEWIQLAQDRDRWRGLVNGDEPSGSGATELVCLNTFHEIQLKLMSGMVIMHNMGYTEISANFYSKLLDHLCHML
jgi:hypothetical protein